MAGLASLQGNAIDVAVAVDMHIQFCSLIAERGNIASQLGVVVPDNAAIAFDGLMKDV